MLPTWFQELLLNSNWGLTFCKPTIQCHRSDLLFWVEVIKGPEWHYIVLKWANNSVGIRSGTANRSPPSLIAVHLLCSKPAVVVSSVHCTLFNMTTLLNHSVAETKECKYRHSSIYTVNVRTHTKQRKQKPRKSRLLSSTKGGGK